MAFLKFHISYSLTWEKRIENVVKDEKIIQSFSGMVFVRHQKNSVVGILSTQVVPCFEASTQEEAKEKRLLVR